MTFYPSKASNRKDPFQLHNWGLVLVQLGSQIGSPKEGASASLGQGRQRLPITKFGFNENRELSPLGHLFQKAISLAEVLE